MTQITGKIIFDLNISLQMKLLETRHDQVYL